MTETIAEKAARKRADRAAAAEAEVERVADAFEGLTLKGDPLIDRAWWSFKVGVPLALDLEAFVAIGLRLGELSEIVRQNALAADEPGLWASTIEPKTDANIQRVTIDLPPLEGT